MKNFLWLALGCIFIAFCNSQSNAQSPNPPPLADSTTLDEVEIEAEKIEETPLGQTMSLIQIDKKFISQNQGNTFINTLEKLPGISAINTGVGISKPVIRGMSFNRVIVNEYGIKQEGQQWGIDHGIEIDQFNVQDVEIIKGPVSLLYGSDGIGGVINILKPKIKPGNYFHTDVTTNYRSNNDTYGTSLMLEGAKNSVFAKARVTVQEYGDYRVPATEFRYNTFKLPILDNRLKNTAGKELNFSLYTGIRKKWGNSSIYISRYGQQAGFFPGAFGIPRAYQLTSDGSTRNIDLPYQNIGHWKAISNTVFTFKNTQANIDLGFQQNNREEHSPPHYHGYESGHHGSMALKLILNTYSLNTIFKTPVTEHWTLIYGVSAQAQQNIRSGYEFLIPNYKTFQSGLYVLNEYKISPKLFLSAGIRGDWARQNLQKSLIPVNDSSHNIINYIQRSPQINKTYLNFSGGTGLAYQLSETYELKYNFGSAFRMPAVSELASNGVHHGTFRHEMGDSTLRAERGYMNDVAVNIKKGKSTFAISPFSYYFSNYIYLSPSAKFSPLPDAGQIYQYTQAPVWMNGVEYTFNLPIAKRWKVLHSLEYVWNRNAANKFPLPFTPPLSLLGELEYKILSNKNWRENRFAISGQYFAAQNRVGRNEAETPGYLLVNINYNSTWNFGKKKISLFVIARNVTNQVYLNNMSRYRILNLPEQGFNLSCMLQVGI